MFAEPFEAFTISPAGASVYQLTQGLGGEALKEDRLPLRARHEAVVSADRWPDHVATVRGPNGDRSRDDRRRIDAPSKFRAATAISAAMATKQIATARMSNHGMLVPPRGPMDWPASILDGHA
jgi:hypothetical protein